MTYWNVGYDDKALPVVYECSAPLAADAADYKRAYGRSMPGYLDKLDALEHQRRDLGLLAEEIEDKLLEVRSEIHRLKGER